MLIVIFQTPTTVYASVVDWTSTFGGGRLVVTTKCSLIDCTWLYNHRRITSRMRVSGRFVYCRVEVACG